MGLILLAAAVGGAPTTTTPAPAPVATPAPAPVHAALPPLDPERLALARQSAQALLPPGALGRLVGGMFDGGFLSSMLDTNPAELIGAPAKDTGGATIRDMISKTDPYFEQRMRISLQVIGSELTRLSPELEPPLRDGLSEALARKFTAAQLTAMNRFFATPDGQAFAGQFLSLWLDPAFIKGYFKTMPVLIRAMPDIMKKVEAATAGLPKPKQSATITTKPIPKRGKR